MDMQAKNEQRVNETMESLNRLQLVEVPDRLKRRLADIPKEIIILEQRVPMKAIWMAAASLFLLIAMNIGSVRHYKNAQQQNDSSIYSEYFSYLDEL